MTTSTTRISGASQAQVVYRGHPDGETVNVGAQLSRRFQATLTAPTNPKHRA